MRGTEPYVMSGVLPSPGVALATGVDVIAISRIERAISRHGDRFLARIYTQRELVRSRGRTAELAARFAAKEAVAKTLGVGMRLMSPAGIGWHEAETLNEASGKPYVVLHSRAAELAEALGLVTWSVSLSHDAGIAVAFVVAVGECRCEQQAFPKRPHSDEWTEA